MELTNINSGIQQVRQQNAVSTPATPQVEEKQTETAAQDTVSVGSGEKEGAIKPHKKWLFFNYIAGDCNLTKYQLDNIDQQEMVGSDENTHIVAFVDSGPSVNLAKLNGEKWSGARTLYVNKDTEKRNLNSEVIENHGDKVDMSDWKVLRDNLVKAIDRFPADHVALIFNDHGGGLVGAMSDDHDGDFMSVPDLAKGIMEAQKITGKKIDIIGMDACLMAETEVAYQFRNAGDIYLASEESEGGPGWNYDSMLGGKTMKDAISHVQESMQNKIDVSPKEFAKIVVDINEQHNNYIPTFSATDLSKMEAVKDSVANLADAIINTKDKATVKQAITESEHYGGYSAPYKDLRDLHHLSRKLIAKSSDPEIKKACEEVQKSLGQAVFANETDPNKYPESKGLSIYAPTFGKMGYNYGDMEFAKDTRWKEAMESLGVKYDPSLKAEAWPDGSKIKQ